MNQEENVTSSNGNEEIEEKKLTLVSESSSNKSTKVNKIEVLFKAVGDAPVLKKRKWAVDRKQKFEYIVTFLRRQLHIDEGGNIFLYINQSFSPSLHTTLENLYECFGSDRQLVIHYCQNKAWG
ncbi:hypothetical protein SNEBB_002060 [Seison nebaliae]|nr:hypothetical protein SNEBB_002060 [Seison nebaliae]